MTYKRISVWADHSSAVSEEIRAARLKIKSNSRFLSTVHDMTFNVGMPPLENELK